MGRGAWLRSLLVMIGLQEAQGNSGGFYSQTIYYQEFTKYWSQQGLSDKSKRPQRKSALVALEFDGLEMDIPAP